jgi:hypothetical protein
MTRTHIAERSGRAECGELRPGAARARRDDRGQDRKLPYGPAKIAFFWAWLKWVSGYE